MEAVTKKPPSPERLIHLPIVGGWLLCSGTACLHLSNLCLIPIHLNLMFLPPRQTALFASYITEDKSLKPTQVKASFNGSALVYCPGFSQVLCRVEALVCPNVTVNVFSHFPVPLLLIFPLNKQLWSFQFLWICFPIVSEQFQRYSKFSEAFSVLFFRLLCERSYNYSYA